MSKLKIEDLDKVAQKTQNELSLTSGNKHARVTVHMGTCGISAGAQKILDETTRRVADLADAGVLLTTSGCAGLCSREPMMTVELADQEPVMYVDLTEDKVKEIIEQHVKSGKIVRDYALVTGRERVL